MPLVQVSDVRGRLVRTSHGWKDSKREIILLEMVRPGQGWSLFIVFPWRPRGSVDVIAEQSERPSS